MRSPDPTPSSRRAHFSLFDWSPNFRSSACDGTVDADVVDDRETSLVRASILPLVEHDGHRLNRARYGVRVNRWAPAIEAKHQPKCHCHCTTKPVAFCLSGNLMSERRLVRATKRQTSMAM
jgi:hypothetical protein